MKTTGIFSGGAAESSAISKAEQGVATTCGQLSPVGGEREISPLPAPCRIVAAAICEGKMVCSSPRPGRHHDVIRAMATAGIPIPIIGTQGFLTSDGVFVDRVVAREIAERAGQIVTKHGSPNELYSEDIW